MTCAACVRRIEKALRGVVGVKEASVNLVTNRATVTFDTGVTSPAALAQAVVGAGYEVPEVPGVVQAENFDEVLRDIGLGNHAALLVAQKLVHHETPDKEPHALLIAGTEGMF